jgi:hypothetical protein
MYGTVCFSAVRGGARVVGVPWQFTFDPPDDGFTTDIQPNGVRVIGDHTTVTATALGLVATTTVTFH